MKDAFLVGEHIYLRHLMADDLTDAYRQWFNDAEVCQYNEHHRFPMVPERMQEYYEQVIRPRQDLVLGIFDSHTDAHIGNVSLQNMESTNRSAEFAIIIGNKTFWGKGIGQEAARLIITHGFRQLNLHRIFCGTTAPNAAMQKLAERLGFVREGASRSAVFKDGTFQDVIQYGLLADEYRP